MTPLKRVSPRAKLTDDERRAIAEAEALEQAGQEVAQGQEGKKNLPPQDVELPNIETAGKQSNQQVSILASQQDALLIGEHLETSTLEIVLSPVISGEGGPDVSIGDKVPTLDVSVATLEQVSDSNTPQAGHETGETVGDREPPTAQEQVTLPTETSTVQTVTMLSPEQLNDLAMRLIRLSADQPGRLPEKKDREQQAVYLPINKRRVLALLRSIEGRQISEIIEDAFDLYFAQSPHYEMFKGLLDT